MRVDAHTIGSLHEKKLLVALLAALLLLGTAVMQWRSSEREIPIASAAAVDYFLKIEGVEGEASHQGLTGAMDLESFSWGVTSPRDAASGLATGRRQHRPVTFKKTIDKASPVLFQSAPLGNHYPTAVLIALRTDGSEAMRITFFDVFITDYIQTGAGDLPMEEVSMNYAKIEFKYTPQMADGKAGTPIVRGWDLGKNKAL